VTVVVTLTSDKFSFPNGASHELVLNRPTTSWRFTAQARTSGDRLPIDVSLHTQNGQLLLAHTVLTVHSTSISFVGVALTVLAGAVLLVWWGRTWRRSRRQRPRAH
jgi:Flp pilus assembly protein TadB